MIEIIELAVLFTYILFVANMAWRTFGILMRVYDSIQKGTKWMITAGNGWLLMIGWTLVFFLPHVGALIFD